VEAPRKIRKFLDRNILKTENNLFFTHGLISVVS
jgi:hypothetical protein